MALVPNLIRNSVDAFRSLPDLGLGFLQELGIIPIQWGIFNEDDENVVTADSVTAFEFKREWSVSDYPVEKGAFESYNKVSTPFTARVVFTSGGSESNRESLLDIIDKIAGDLELYNVVTPERTYKSCNITHYDYRRSADNGVGMISVAVWLVEVRVTGVETVSTTARPSGYEIGPNGQTTPTEASSTQKTFVRGDPERYSETVQPGAF